MRRVLLLIGFGFTGQCMLWEDIIAEKAVLDYETYEQCRDRVGALLPCSYDGDCKCQNQLCFKGQCKACEEISQSDCGNTQNKCAFETEHRRCLSKMLCQDLDKVGCDAEFLKGNCAWQWGKGPCKPMAPCTLLDRNGCSFSDTGHCWWNRRDGLKDAIAPIPQQKCVYRPAFLTSLGCLEAAGSEAFCKQMAECQWREAKYEDEKNVMEEEGYELEGTQCMLKVEEADPCLENFLARHCKKNRWCQWDEENEKCFKIVRAHKCDGYEKRPCGKIEGCDFVNGKCIERSGPNKKECKKAGKAECKGSEAYIECMVSECSKLGCKPSKKGKGGVTKKVKCKLPK